jgi:uncharacterized protein YbcI
MGEIESTDGASPPAADGALRAGQLTQITRAMVAIYKEQFGRGPKRAHTHYSGPDGITCFLEESLTPVEQRLALIGEHQRLRDIRMLFQYTAEDSFRDAVESITGRKVIAFLSSIDTNADIATETFLLEPAAQPART